MGGPSYETPYPVDAGKGDQSQVIWNWNTKSWGPYTPPDPNKKGTPPGAGSPDAAGGTDRGPASPGAEPGMGTGDRNPGDRNSSPGPSFGGNASGSGIPLRRRTGGTTRRGGLPGSSLLQDY